MQPQLAQLLVVPNGSDGWNAQDWASNLLYLGQNQWDGNKQAVFDSLNNYVSADTKIYIGGQSLGGALAQFLAVDYVNQQLAANPAYNASNVALA